MSQFDEIVWPKKPALRDPKAWKKAVRLVKNLCSIGKVTKWLNGNEKKDIFSHMAYHYIVLGEQIRFLPHWGFIYISGYEIDTLPSSLLELLWKILLVKSGFVKGFRKTRY